MSENGGFVNCRLLTMPDLLGELAPDMEYIVRAGWVPSGQGYLISKKLFAASTTWIFSIKSVYDLIHTSILKKIPQIYFYLLRL